MNKKLFFVFSIDYQLISHRRRVVEAAIQNGYHVTVVAQDTGYRKEIESIGCDFIELPINRVGTNIFEELKTLRFLYKLYRKEKPQIVHHVSIKVSLWGGLAARLARVNGVVNAINGLGVFFESGELDSMVKKVFMRIIRFSNHRKNCVTIFQNNDDKGFFVNNHGIKPEQCRMISGSGVDLEEFAYSEVPADLPMKIVFTSRMVKEKGVLDIIEAAKILREKYYDKIQFQLCGLIETSPTAIPSSLLETECDGKYLCYMGHVKNVKQVLTESTIVLLPSYYREGIPKSLIEATSIGRPIVTTDWVGCRETVKDGVNGYIIPIKSPTVLAERLEQIITNPELAKRMGEASRQLAETMFSINTVVDAHLTIYQELLDKCK